MLVGGSGVFLTITTLVIHLTNLGDSSACNPTKPATIIKHIQPNHTQHTRRTPITTNTTINYAKLADDAADTYTSARDALNRAITARARLTDPQTSWDAALAVNATKSWLQFATLKVIEKAEWISEELTEEAFFTTTLTPSRVRTIVSDWRKEGYVEALPKRAKTSTGRTAQLNRLTTQGRELVAVLREINRKANQQ